MVNLEKNDINEEELHNNKKIMEKYLKKIRIKYIEDLQNNEQLTNWKKYEIKSALTFGAILWEDMPPIVKKLNNIPYSADYGIDLFKIDDNYKIIEAFQTKCYEKNKHIKFTDY